MTRSARDFIESLQLQPHPEGGYYRELYRSEKSLPATDFGIKGEGDRSFFTSIYFLLEKGNVSHFHKIQSDESWYFHAGGGIKLYELLPDGRGRSVLIGDSTESEGMFQYNVKAGNWFAAEVIHGDFCLLGCAVAPGFDFRDFELASKDDLLNSHPGEAEWINRLCVS